MVFNDKSKVNIKAVCDFVIICGSDNWIINICGSECIFLLFTLFIHIIFKWVPFREGAAIGLFYNNVFLFVGLTTLGTFIKFWLVCSFSWDAAQPLIVIYRRGNFVYHLKRCTPIYWPLSYPLGFLGFIIILRIQDSH